MALPQKISFKNYKDTTLTQQTLFCSFRTARRQRHLSDPNISINYRLEKTNLLCKYKARSVNHEQTLTRFLYIHVI